MNRRYQKVAQDVRAAIAARMTEKKPRNKEIFREERN
jgi:hypothetical protein